MRLRHLLATAVLVFLVPCGRAAATWPVGGAASGPIAPGGNPSLPEVAGDRAEIIHGLAYAPSDAPIEVKEAIWAGDRIRFTPYVYGGGHGDWNAGGFDCSGSVSYVLHAAGLLKTALDSSDFAGWGRAGDGRWMTVFTNPGHSFIEIAGIRFDTSAAGDPGPIPGGSGPRWRPLLTDTTGFSARYPSGY